MVKEEFTRLQIRLQPNAGQDRVVGLENGVYKVKVTAPPVEGRANRKLVEFLSDILDTAKSNIFIESGATGRQKIIGIRSLSPAQVRERLERQIELK